VTIPSLLFMLTPVFGIFGFDENKFQPCGH